MIERTFMMTPFGVVVETTTVQTGMQERRSTKADHECEICGEAGGDVERRIDPYLFEIYNERRSVMMCDQCFEDRAGDI